MSDELRYDGRVAIVTGAGGGLGREYALLLASRGASVVVNDLGGSRDGEGQSSRAADIVVDEIRSKGGKAVPDYHSVEDGEKLVKTALDSFGRIDIIINNAGILRDKSILKITEQDWDLIHRIHLKAAFLIVRAAWPHFKQQNYGRIIVTASTAGLYGNFGQTNYAAAKIGLIGLSNTFAVEGSKYNIQSNVIVPVAGSRLTEDILPENLFKQLKPEFVAPVTVYLCHESCPESGGVFEAAGGWIGRYKWSRSLGKTFLPPETLTLETLRESWPKVVDMKNASQPKTIHDQMSLLHNSLSGADVPITDVKESSEEAGLHRYSPDDLILYALSVGTNANDSTNLKFLYEGHDAFQPLPTYGVIPCISAFSDSALLNEALKPYNIEFNPTKLVHGEQFIELKKPLSSSGLLKSKARVIDVLDKGSGALIILECVTTDETGDVVCVNQGGIFLVGAGQFGGEKMSKKPEVKEVVDPPQRTPDISVSEKTSAEQAALYRLTGDKNPLHIDPQFAALGGFEKPILHGLCSFGYVTRHVMRQFANNDPSKIKAIKARFASSVYPGQTLRTDMWREGNRIHFQCVCLETDKLVISGAYVDLLEVIEPKLPKVATSIEDPENPTPAELAFDTDDANGLLTDVVFEEIGRRIQMAPELGKKVNGIFTFVIVKDRTEAKAWTMDMKTYPGVLYEGHSKGAPADCVIRITDADMAALAVGEMDPVRAFMTGKLKIKGNLMATQRLQALFELNSASVYENDEVLTGKGTDDQSASSDNKWNEMSTMASAGSSFAGRGHNSYPDYSLARGGDFMMAADGSGGDGGSGGSGGITPIIDMLFEKWLPTRLDDMKDLVPIIKTVYQWNILQKGKVASVWTLDLKNGGGAIYRDAPKSGKADCILSIEDDNAVKIFEGKEDAMRAFMSGKLKITGNIMAAQKLQQVWGDEAEQVRGVLADLKAGRVISSAPASATPSVPNGSGATVASITDASTLDAEAYPISGVKGDIFFNIFRTRCHEEPEFMQRLRVCFQFNITKNGKAVCIWTADNKTTRDITIYRNPPKGIKPDVTATVEDDDLLKILTGRVNPQRLFMMGRVRVKGNIMLLQKLNGLWHEFQKLGRTPELPLIVDIMLDDPVIPNLYSEAAVIECIQRMVRVPEMKPIGGYHQLDIIKDEKVVSTWTLDLKDRSSYVRGLPNKGASKPDSKMTVDDITFTKMVSRQTTFKEAKGLGLVHFEGDERIIPIYEKVYSQPTSIKPKL